jgi:hypothetical protein
VLAPANAMVKFFPAQILPLLTETTGTALMVIVIALLLLQPAELVATTLLLNVLVAVLVIVFITYVAPVLFPFQV